MLNFQCGVGSPPLLWVVNRGKFTGYSRYKGNKIPRGEPKLAKQRLQSGPLQTASALRELAEIKPKKATVNHSGKSPKIWTTVLSFTCIPDGSYKRNENLNADHKLRIITQNQNSTKIK